MLDSVYCTIANEVDRNSECVTTELMCKTVEFFKLLDVQSDEIKVNSLKKIHILALQSKPLIKVWLYSAIINNIHDADIVEEFLEYVISEKEFIHNIKYFLFYQITYKIFSNSYLNNGYMKYLRWRLLEHIVTLFKNDTKDLLEFIPYEQRNFDAAFVITEQIIISQHAPTKTALDKCVFLIRNLHKNVLLINTAEVLTKVGKIPYYSSNTGTYIRECLLKEAIEWKGEKIPYFQCENNMPNIGMLREILQIVRRVKPCFVISIGGNSILASLIDNIIPVVSFSLTGDMQPSITSFRTTSKKIDAGDIQLLRRMGISEDTVIQARPTVNMDIQISEVTKEQLGLPENKFIFFIVGGRLDDEIDRSFMQMLADILDDDMAVAFVGKFLTYEKYIKEIPELERKVYNLGFADDLLAWMEVCDLYINPNRIGGGTSAAEALFKGVPVITMRYGDVYVLAGEEFSTESYDTMPQLILKYKNDKDFYHKMSELAKERGRSLIDSAENFQQVIEEYQCRMIKKEQQMRRETV